MMCNDICRSVPLNSSLELTWRCQVGASMSRVRVDIMYLDILILIPCGYLVLDIYRYILDVDRYLVSLAS